MRTWPIVAALLALAALTNPGTALVGDARVDSAFAGEGWVGDEPNVAAGGTLPYAWDASPSARHPADANGLADAKAGAPTRVLAVEWVQRACAYGVDCAATSAAPLWDSLAQGGGFLAGVGRFHAWLGTFADADGDGWIDDAAVDDRLHASLAGDCGGPYGSGELRTDDREGVGKPQGATTGLSLRCARSDEWHGEDGRVVAYVTPGRWDGADVANRAFHAWNPLAAPPRPAAERPDLAFAHLVRDGAPTGRHVAPASGYDYTPVDRGVLTTTVVEAIADPVVVIGGPRTHEPGEASLVDVDLYNAIDPTVEALYQTSIGAVLASGGCDAARPEAGCPAASEPLVAPLRAAREDALPAAGPAVAAIAPPRERHPQGVDGGGLFFDLQLETSLAVALVRGEADFGRTAERAAPFSNAHLSPTADGRAHAWPHASVRARLGFWSDANGDGWIGAPEAAAGCPDPHDCGATPDPHEYGSDEFAPLCGRHEAEGLAPAADGAFLATLTPLGGRWGFAGVHVLTDRREGFDAGRDNLRDDGRAPFNPYDDLALNAFATHRFTNAIRLTMTCSDDLPGQYRSYERLVFPEGTNWAYAFTLEGVTTAAWAVHGVLGVATVEDVDVVGGVAG